MIHRTVLEWQAIRHGDGPAEIPERTAGTLAAVARASPFAGRGGEGVLEHGRTALRARGVVGVIAAEGASLEILPKIDVGEGEGATGRIRRRLVHMLGVALDLRIDAGRLTALDWQRETLLEILIRLFAEKLADAVRLGRPRQYVQHEDDLPALRGRLDAVRQFTRNAAAPQRLACRFDALTPDIALNRIMKSAVTQLARAARTAPNQRRLADLAFAFADVADVPPRELRFDAVVLDRTNARWRELLDLARLLLGGRHQSTSAGAANGFSLLFEMSALFEAYVARMLARAVAGAGLSVVAQGGRLFCLEAEDGRQLFQTKPDILVKQGGDVVRVIDTKWKRLTPAADDPKRGVLQADVYQMMAYGQLYGCERLTLLYPHHAGLGAEALQVGHRVAGDGPSLDVATVNVAAGDSLRERLRALCPELADEGARREGRRLERA